MCAATKPGIDGSRVDKRKGRPVKLIYVCLEGWQFSVAPFSQAPELRAAGRPTLSGWLTYYNAFTQQLLQVMRPQQGLMLAWPQLALQHCLAAGRISRGQPAPPRSV